MQTEQLRIEFRVTGEVQGVSFREAARQQADELGVKGFIRNEPDGSVYGEAEGEVEKVSSFAAWLEEGSGSARVTDVELDELDPVGYEAFGVEG